MGLSERERNLNPARHGGLLKRQCPITALYQALGRARRAPWTAAITDCIPTMVQPDRCAALNILRTTFEVDRLPGDWLPAIEPFDEVWVTSEFAARTFRRSGVAPSRCT
jgi:hypothetical protein